MYFLQVGVGCKLKRIIFRFVHYVTMCCSLSLGLIVHSFFKCGSIKGDDIYWMDFGIFI